MAETLNPLHNWIVSPQAEPYLRLAEEHLGTQPQLISKLRKRLTASEAAEVVRQIHLRRRATKKFSRASRMFFTEKGLQQATDERTARYKSGYFQRGPLADIGCGLGGDLMALAVVQPTVGIDRDAQCTLFARKNCEAVEHVEATIVRMRAERFSLAEVAAWHADPDRRALKPRSSQLEWSEPGAADLDRGLQKNPHAGIKLAPGARIPASWADQAEAEWIGEQDECRQLFLRFGGLTKAHGVRTATLIDAQGQVAGRVHGACWPRQVSTRILRFVFEPHACVRAAGLTDALAQQYGLQRVSADAPYLTGDQIIHDRLLAAFAVVEVLPFDLRRLKQAVRQRGWSRLEIKKRGSPVHPERLMRKLRVRGDEQGVILVSPHGGQICAILAQRIPWVTR